MAGSLRAWIETPRAEKGMKWIEYDFNTLSYLIFSTAVRFCACLWTFYWSKIYTRKHKHICVPKWIFTNWTHPAPWIRNRTLATSESPAHAPIQSLPVTSSIGIVHFLLSLLESHIECPLLYLPSFSQHHVCKANSCWVWLWVIHLFGVQCPIGENTTIYFPILPLKDIWAVYSFELSWIMQLLYIFLELYFGKHTYIHILRSEIPWWSGMVMFSLSRYC